METLVLREPDQPGHDPMLGRVIDGRYRLVGLIGRGGCGAVYRALHVGMEREVAVKVLDFDGSSDMTDIVRFEQEARALARMRHPHIVDIYDCGRSDGVLYIAMELLEGQSLATALRAGGPMSEAAVIELARAVVEALAHAHARQIVHRDVKPMNVFLALGHRGAVVPKLLDFGIARIGGDLAPDTTITREGAILGSPPYMSPEQCQAAPVTAQSDIYSLGCVLYECISGRRVFPHRTLAAFALSHCMETPLVPSRDGVPSSGPFIDLIMQMLAKRPEDRPASAEAILTRLDALTLAPVPSPITVTSGSATPAPSDGSISTGRIARPDRAPSRRRAWVTGAVALVVGLTIVVASSLGPSSDEPASTADATTLGKAAEGRTATLALASPEPAPAPPAPDDVAGPAASATVPQPTPDAVAGQTLDAVPVSETASEAPAIPVAPSIVTLRVRLESDPAAEVRSGKTLLGTTPYDLTWPEGSAPPRVTLSASGRASRVVELDAHDIEVGTKRVTLSRKPTLTPVTEPW